MNQPTYSDQQEEWLKVLDKGLITIPKNWREEMGMEPGKIVRARRDGNKVILEPQVKYAPFRIYTDQEIDQFLKDDKLPKSLAKKGSPTFKEPSVMIKVFFDASVIIAAMLSPTGGSAQLIEYIHKRKIVGVISQTVIEEIISHKEKFKKTDREIELFVMKALFLVREKIHEEEEAKYVGQVDQDDAHLVAGAKLTKCQYLVTLDKKHLLPPAVRKEFKPLKIISPKELLTKILQTA